LKQGYFWPKKTKSQEKILGKREGEDGKEIENLAVWLLVLFAKAKGL